MNSLKIYYKQRINLALWSLVTLFLVALSLQEFHLSKFHILSFPFVLFFLLNMRLFDDLANVEFDANKENRAYTNPIHQQDLKKLLIAGNLILLITLFLFSQQRALYLFLFLLLNQFFYAFFIKVGNFRYFLPLLKYPFVIFLLNLSYSYTISEVFIAFIVFEILDDKTFPGELLSSNKISLKTQKVLAYLFLLLILVFHLILIY